MPKLYRNKGQYSFSSKYKQSGDIEYEIVDTEKFSQISSEESFQNPKKNESDYNSPTKWLSKNLLETSNNDPESNSKISNSRNIRYEYPAGIHTQRLNSMKSSNLKNTRDCKSK